MPGPATTMVLLPSDLLKAKVLQTMPTGQKQKVFSRYVLCDLKATQKNNSGPAHFARHQELRVVQCSWISAVLKGKWLCELDTTSEAMQMTHPAYLQRLQQDSVVNVWKPGQFLLLLRPTIIFKVADSRLSGHLRLLSPWQSCPSAPLHAMHCCWLHACAIAVGLAR